MTSSQLEAMLHSRFWIWLDTAVMRRFQLLQMLHVPWTFPTGVLWDASRWWMDSVSETKRTGGVLCQEVGLLQIRFWISGMYVEILLFCWILSHLRQNTCLSSEAWVSTLMEIAETIKILCFADCSVDHWLGLERVHLLTKDNYKEWTLRVDLWDHEGGTAYAEYNNFKIGNEATAYKLQVGRYSGNAGNFSSPNKTLVCLVHHNRWHNFRWHWKLVYQRVALWFCKLNISKRRSLCPPRQCHPWDLSGRQPKRLRLQHHWPRQRRLLPVYIWWHH